jgi:hypothetical protein
MSSLRLSRPPPAALLAAGTCLLLCACASYPDRHREALDDLRRGRFEEAASSFGDVPGFLGPAEAGTVRFAAGDWAGAQEQLLAAVQVIAALEDRGPLSASGLAEDAGTLLLNESAAAYPGEGFERIQVHALLALTFLAQGNLEGVGVEVRRADRLLQQEQELYSAEYPAGGLGHWISALAYELRGEPDQALIDYRRMAEKGLAPSLVGPELMRLAASLRRDDLLPQWEQQYGPAPVVPSGSARVVLIAGLGLAPVKVEEALRLPTPAGVVAWAVPNYVARPQPVEALELDLGPGRPRVRTVVIESIAEVAERNLQDRLALLATKSAVRAGSRTVLAKNLRDSDNYGAALAVDLFSLFAERADLRSWLTLPDNWSAAQVFLPAGVHRLTLTALGGDRRELGQFEFEPGETVFVLARTVDRSLFAHVVGGRPLDDRSPAPSAPAPSAAADAGDIGTAP